MQLGTNQPWAVQKVPPHDSVFLMFSPHNKELVLAAYNKPSNITNATGGAGGGIRVPKFHHLSESE